MSEWNARVACQAVAAEWCIGTCLNRFLLIFGARYCGRTNLVRYTWTRNWHGVKWPLNLRRRFSTYAHWETSKTIGADPSNDRESLRLLELFGVLSLQVFLLVHHCVGSRNQLLERFVYSQMTACFADAELIG